MKWLISIAEKLMPQITAYLIASGKDWLTRGKAITDGGAWLLIVPFALFWNQVDSADIKTSLVWLLKLPIIVGVVIILSRLVFPQIRLGSLMQKVDDGNVAAAIVVSGLLLFVGLLIMTATGWAK